MHTSTPDSKTNPRLWNDSGIAFNPMTPLDDLEYLLPEVDRVLVMALTPAMQDKK
jgi:pentose-5-phosphate-3-epimerase